MSRGLRKALALGLVPTILAITGGLAPALAAETVFQGRVVGADGVQSAEGVVVSLIDPATGMRWSAAPTDRRGAFRVDGAGPGTYGVVAETDRGAFLAASEFELNEESVPVTLSLRPFAEDDGDEDPEDPAAPTPASAGTRQGMPKWAKGLLGSGIALGALGLTQLLGDEEKVSSAF